MPTTPAKVTVTPAPYTERRDLLCVSAPFASDAGNLAELLVDEGLTEPDCEVAVTLGTLDPGARWRKPMGGTHYVVLDTRRFWAHLPDCSLPLLVFSVDDGGHRISDSKADLVVVVTLDQLPCWGLLEGLLDYLTEDK